MTTQQPTNNPLDHAPVDVLAVIEANGELTPAQLAASGSVDDLHRWMAEATQDRGRALKIAEAASSIAVRRTYEGEATNLQAVWLACRDELDRRAALARVSGGGK